jgi:hypothetical protein
MKSNQQLGILLLSALVLIALMVFMSNVLSEDENPNLAGAEFLVS